MSQVSLSSGVGRRKWEDMTVREQSNRDRKIGQAVLGGVVGSVLIAVLGVVGGVLANQTGSSFLKGFTLGVLVTLPVGLAVMFWKAFSQMDEYGQRLHQRAASAAFFVTMTATGVAFALSAGLKFQLPLWTVYAFGMTCWGIATAVISARERGQA